MFDLVINWLIQSLFVFVLQNHRSLNSDQTAQSWRFYVVFYLALTVQRMLHILCKQSDEFFLNELVQNLPVHNSSTNHNHFRRYCQCHIQTKLSQVITQHSPYLFLVWNLVQLREINIQTLSNWFIADHSLQTWFVEGTNTLKVFIFLPMPINSILLLILT